MAMRRGVNPEALPPRLRNAFAELLLDALDEIRQQPVCRDVAQSALALLEAHGRTARTAADRMPLAAVAQAARPLPRGRALAVAAGVQRLVHAGLFEEPPHGRTGIALALRPEVRPVRAALCQRAAASWSALHAAAALAPGDPLARGLAEAAILFDAGLYFEVHELLEGHWRNTAGPQRRLLQGLIQIAVAFHHYERANTRGASRLLREGLEKVAAPSPEGMNLDLRDFRASVAAWLDFLEKRTATAKDRPSPPPWPVLPVSGRRAR